MLFGWASAVLEDVDMYVIFAVIPLAAAAVPSPGSRWRSRLYVYGCSLYAVVTFKLSYV